MVFSAIRNKWTQGQRQRLGHWALAERRLAAHRWLVSDAALRQVLEAALGAQYDIVRLLGRGGAGEVYLATERLLERPVAIKVLHRGADDGASRQRFLREARTAARLSHPNIVPLLSFGESGDTLFYVMPYVEGESLETLLRRDGRLHPADARRILGDVASALAYAHQHGVVHRDVKPDNVLIERESGRAMLTDFGIARLNAEAPALTQTGTIVGTPHYMSPEQASGERAVDGRADLYALGVIGYRMLSGRLPFEGRTIEEVLARRFTTDPPPLTTLVADLPIDLASAVSRCLEREPSARWPDAPSFRFAIGTDAASEDLPDVLETLPRFGTGAVGVLYLTAVVSSALFAWDYDPVWYALLGPAVILGFATVGVVARAPRRGLPWRRALRLVFLPPSGWGMWWPRALRATNDVWDRLPRPLRVARALLGAAVLGFSVVGVGAELALIIARHHKPVAHAFLGLTLASMAAFVSCAVASQIIAWRFVRTLGLDRYERYKLLQERTSGSKFWTRPAIARLLLPARAAESRAGGPRTVGEYAREIRALAARVPPHARDAAGQAGRVLGELVRRVDGVDGELRQLAAHHDPAERVRVEERLTALGVAQPGESPAIAQMRQLLASQLELASQFGRRQTELRERRALLEEQARTLWLQTVRLADDAARDRAEAADLTDETRRLCESIERRIEAAMEVRRFTAEDAAR